MIGKESLEKHKYTYLYKDEVEIPPLTMVDDVILVAECGYKSAMANSYMQSKTNSKKLQFGGEKCKKIHVGKKEEFKCGTLFVDKWNEIEKKNEINGKIEVEDICVGVLWMNIAPCPRILLTVTSWRALITTGWLLFQAVWNE